MEIALIVAVMGLSLVPAGIARALSARTAGFVAALVVAFAWLGASGFYFTVFLQLGNRSAAWVGALGVTLGAAVVGLASSAFAARRHRGNTDVVALEPLDGGG